jgi:hypothetical protein
MKIYYINPHHLYACIFLSFFISFSILLFAFNSHQTKIDIFLSEWKILASGRLAFELGVSDENFEATYIWIQPSYDAKISMKVLCKKSLSLQKVWCQWEIYFKYSDSK